MSLNVDVNVMKADPYLVLRLKDTMNHVQSIRVLVVLHTGPLSFANRRVWITMSAKLFFSYCTIVQYCFGVNVPMPRSSCRYCTLAGGKLYCSTVVLVLYCTARGLPAHLLRTIRGTCSFRLESLF